MDTAIKTIPSIRVLYRRDRLTIPGVPAHAGPAIDSLMDALRQADVRPAGPVIFVYYGIEADPTQEFDLDVCVPILAEAVITSAAPIGCKMLPAFECISAEYVGSMHGIGNAWHQVASAWRASGRPACGESREVYKQWISFDSQENVTELQKGIQRSA
ncbi:MAG TPA: GyrI-like domain-containing protein [Tepidisphaeraceae bacterium]|jgi:effector-binding domain-containing protein|nr:GyrI-like domain-containing protein [Tepidisphaeraceae bacterium]